MKINPYLVRTKTNTHLDVTVLTTMSIKGNVKQFQRKEKKSIHSRLKKKNYLINGSYLKPVYQFLAQPLALRNNCSQI